MPTPHTSAILSIAATQIITEIAEYERMLACIPSESNDRDDLITRRLFYRLIRDRHAALDNLDQLAIDIDRNALPGG